jgi:multiple sugar transport system substrate-binding protein
MHANIQKVVKHLLLGAALVGGGASAQTPVSVWVHAGPGPERDVYVASVKAFNESQKDIKVDLVALPEGSYSDQVNAAALAKKLPCILDFDGPNVYNYAWTKKIIPLDDFPSLKTVKADLLPSLLRQGTYNKKLYSLGQYDSGLAIWGNRKLLTQAGVRIPAKVGEAWTLEEFEDALKKLKAMGVAFPLDMKFNYGVSGEWYTYGFSPILQSFGGDLVNRKDFQSASGAINGPEAIKALGTLQSWVKAGYVNAATKDDSDFVKGNAALSYVGHWTYGDYKKALGDDLVLIPMPKFGGKAVTGAGSWNFGISANCKEPQAAAKVLGYFMSMPEITRVTQVNGAIPGTFAAMNANKKFFKGGELEIYAQQAAEKVSLVRPETPAYPTITTAFAEAVNNIVAGADVKAELDKAAKKIDQNIEDNKGYPVK